MLLISNCSSDSIANGFNKHKVIGSENDSVQSISLDEATDSIEFPISIILPIAICTNESSTILYDYSESVIKVLNSNGTYKVFDPMGSGNERLSGTYFNNVGYSGKDLIISSGSSIQKYFLDEEIFSTSIDTFEQCSDFTFKFNELFIDEFEGDSIIISLDGIPCINTPRGNTPFTVDEFKSIKFARVKNLSLNESNYTFRIPISNPIIDKQKLYVSTNPKLTYHNGKNRFYAIISPTPYLYEYKLDISLMEFKLINTWKINLPSIDIPINFTLNKGIDTELIDKNLKYNPEIKLVEAINDHIIVLYRPSKNTDIANIADSKFPHHYLLAIINIETEEVKVYAVDYNKMSYLGCQENGDMLFYDKLSSERSNQVISIVKKINMNSLTNKEI